MSNEAARKSNERGIWAEDVACANLLERGLRMIVRNYRCRHGEIDLVMHDGETIVFVEVRMRSRSDYGSGTESIDLRKRRRLVFSAEHYLQRYASSLTACRFDVVSIDRNGTGHELTWIRDAFDA